MSMVESFLGKLNDLPQGKLYHFHNLGKAKTIVLLNGLFAAYQSWDSLLPELLKEYNVLQFNFYGQGVLEYESLEKVNLKCHAEQLHQLLQELGIEKCEMIGLSHGARVGLYYVGHFENKVERFFAANTYLNADIALKSKLLSWLTANRIGGGKHRFDVALPWVWGRTFLENNSEIIDYYREKSDLISSSLSHQLILQSMQEHDFQIENYAGELLVGSSEEDLLTPRIYQKEILAKKSNAKHIRLQGGHASLIEYPLQLFEILRREVDRVV